MNLRLTTVTAAVALMFFTPIASYPQDSPPTPPGTVAPSAVDTKSDTYTQRKLDQILAPIALYPDQLVTQNSHGFDLSAGDCRGGALAR